MSLLFANITKTEDTTDGLIVEGIASTEAIDGEGEIVDYDSLKAALPDYWGNIREMHQPSAVGKALVITPDDEQRTLFLRALIVDDSAAKKVRTGVYKGWSIGGKAERKVTKTAEGTQTRAFVRSLTEISLADRPANPDAKITLFKVEGMPMPNEPEKTDQGAEHPDALGALQKLAERVQPLLKASADPSKIVSSIQAARNEAELSGDMDGAQLYTQAIALVMQAAGEAKETPAQQAAEDEAGTEGTPEDAEQDAALMLAAKIANIKKMYPNLSDAGVAEFAKAGYVPGTVLKAGRAISGGRMAALKTAAKALMQMAADAGDEECAAAMKAFGAGAPAADSGDQMEMAVKVLTSELEKVLNPVAVVLTHIDSRLTKIEATPVAGGPVLRPVTKQIGTQTPAQPEKPAMTPLIKAQIADLWQKAHTDNNPTRRADYLKQHNDLKAQYEG